MNLFFPIFCVVAAGVAGYSLEPSMRYSLTGEGAPKSKTVAKVDDEAVSPPEAETAPAPAPVTPPAPVPAPVEPPPAATPEPAPTPAPAPTPDPAPVAEVAPEPMEDPEPEPAPPAPSAALSAEEIVAVMQDSIKANQVKEFNFDQVLGWKAGEEEEVDGETYQTGLASYKAETIFGVKTIQAKALIEGGKVAKWIWPNSGMEIK